MMIIKRTIRNILSPEATPSMVDNQQNRTFTLTTSNNNNNNSIPSNEQQKPYEPRQPV